MSQGDGMVPLPTPTRRPVKPPSVIDAGYPSSSKSGVNNRKIFVASETSSDDDTLTPEIEELPCSSSPLHETRGNLPGKKSEPTASPEIDHEPSPEIEDELYVESEDKPPSVPAPIPPSDAEGRSEVEPSPAAESGYCPPSNSSPIPSPRSIAPMPTSRDAGAAMQIQPIAVYSKPQQPASSKSRSGHAHSNGNRSLPSRVGKTDIAEVRPKTKPSPQKPPKSRSLQKSISPPPTKTPPSTPVSVAQHMPSGSVSQVAKPVCNHQTTIRIQTSTSKSVIINSGNGLLPVSPESQLSVSPPSHHDSPVTDTPTATERLTVETVSSTVDTSSGNVQSSVNVDVKSPGRSRRFSCSHPPDIPLSIRSPHPDCLIKLRSKFLDFFDARAFVRKQCLGGGQPEWREYCRSGRLPKNIPENPDIAYTDKGWVSWYDWNGMATAAYYKNLKGPNENDHVSAINVPAKSNAMLKNRPQRQRAESMIGGGSFLNLLSLVKPSAQKNVSFQQGVVRSFVNPGGKVVYREYDAAKKFVHSLFLSGGAKEWREYHRQGLVPGDIPMDPEVIYRNHGWSGWLDWMGGTRSLVPPDHKSLELQQRLLNRRKSMQFKVPYGSEIPLPAEVHVQDPVVRIATCKQNKYLPFEDARRYVRSLTLGGGAAEWRYYCQTRKKPDNIPHDPHLLYKDQWVSWSDWFVGVVPAASTASKSLFMPFINARRFVWGLNLGSVKEWVLFAASFNRPKDIPVNPDRVYENSWQGWEDWLGSTRFRLSGLDQAGSFYRSFKFARAFVRRLGLRSLSEWWSFCESGHLPNDIPSEPAHVYKDVGWSGYGDWLGTAALQRLKLYHGGVITKVLAALLRGVERTVFRRAGVDWDDKQAVKTAIENSKNGMKALKF